MEQIIYSLRKEMVLRGYRQASIDTYCSCLKVIVSKIGERPTIDQIKDFLLTIKNNSYHKQMVATIHKYFNLVLKEGLSLQDIPYPKRVEHIPGILSIEEIKLLYSNINNLKHKLVLSFLYGCGMRVGEVINLKIADLDQSRGIIIIKDAKGGKDRQVMLSDQIYKLFIDYYNYYLPEVYVFNGQKKDQYTERSINELLKYHAKKVGIKKNVHAHTFRHSFATHLLDSGTDMAIIQDLLGHSNIKTTRLYAKLSTRRISQVISPMSNII